MAWRRRYVGCTCLAARSDKQMDELIQERVQSKQNELTAEYDERLRNYEERYACQ